MVVSLSTNISNDHKARPPTFCPEMLWKCHTFDLSGWPFKSIEQTELTPLQNYKVHFIQCFAVEEDKQTLI